MSKVSIIVPVYGVEAYLEACIESLLAQSYANLEILLIDDASPDGCPAICDAYTAKDVRVITIHKQNGGAASARNVGLDHATGDYICFVDSDDLVDRDYVACLLNALGDSDVAVCGYSLLQPNSSSIQNVEPAGEYSGTEYLAQFLKSWRCALIWNKIYRREIVGTTRFQEGRRIDDEFFTYLLIAKCQKVTVISKPLYFYRLRRSSVMNSPSAQQQILLDRVAYLTQRYLYVKNVVPELAQDYLANLLDNFARFWRCCRDILPVKHAIRSWVWHNLFRILMLNRPILYRCILLYQLLRPAGNRPLTDTNSIQADPDAYFD